MIIYNDDTDKIDSIHIDPMFRDKATEIINAYYAWESKQEFVRVAIKQGYKMVLRKKFKKLVLKGVCPGCLQPIEKKSFCCGNCGVKLVIN